MCLATAAGWVSAIACDAGIAMVGALARRAMNRWPSGGISSTAGGYDAAYRFGVGSPMANPSPVPILMR
jgi:hypothetical protein